MAWDVAAYGITVAILTIAVACVIGTVQACRLLRRLAATVDRLTVEAEASLLQCKQVAEEAKSAIVEARQMMDGYSSLADGARALGEATQLAALGITNMATYCRDRLSSFVPHENPDITDIGRSLWQWWRSRRSASESTPDSSHPIGPSADPSQGE
jgi:hypothetical protein